LTVTDQAARGVTETDLSLICVGTPSAPNGELDLGFVLKVCFDIGQAIRDKKTPHIVVLRSTLLPGSIQGSILPLLERSSGKSEGEGFHLVINPEFLREGTSVQDFHKPPKTVIGAFSEEAGDTVAALYEGIEAPLIRTTPEVAEMVKYADNLYHATKIVFANEIGRLCKSLGLDSHAVMNIFLQDTKLNVSPAYLKPGFAFGGSCLPKDIRAMLYFGKKHDVETPLLASLIQSNRRHVDLAFRLIQGSSGRKAVALLGLSFKSGTDDLRESPLVDLVEILLGKGYPVRIYDPNVALSRLLGANKAYIEAHLPHIGELIVNSAEEALDGAELIVLGNRVPEYKKIVEDQAKGRPVVDLVRLFDKPSDEGYQGIAW